MIIVNNQSPKYKQIVDNFRSVAPVNKAHMKAFETWLGEHHAYMDAGNHIRFDRDEDATVFMLKIRLTAG